VAIVVPLHDIKLLLQLQQLLGISLGMMRYLIRMFVMLMMMTVELWQVLSDARADAVTITPRHLFSVVLCLVKAGHSQHIDKVGFPQ